MPWLMTLLAPCRRSSTATLGTLTASRPLLGGMVELVAVLQDRKVTSLPRHLIAHQLGLLPGTSPARHDLATKEVLAAHNFPAELGRELRDIG